MSYGATATHYVAATIGDSTAAEHLPMSRWAEARRADMTPEVIAANHALHVEGLAAELREVVDKWDNSDGTEPDDFERMLAHAAEDLLAAIGEGE